MISGGTARNCSVKNLQIDIESQSSLEDVLVGGIAGEAINSIIENCYVQNLQIKDSAGINTGIGGIVGNLRNSCSVRNCYATGRIISKNVNVGGIVGNGGTSAIENCYSKVDITTENVNVGGIVGSYSGTTLTNISNNLSIGNIFTNMGSNYLGRILGNSNTTEENNYSYEKQLINGYKNEEQKGATLLNKEEVLKLNLGEYYNYDSSDKAILPKLYNTEKTELLPYQDDILLEEDSKSGALEIESIQANKTSTSEAEINIRINNPEELEITEIKIEDMKTSILRKATQNGITNLVVQGTPERYYDAYKLVELKYLEENTEKIEQTKQVEIEVPIQFYKEIYTFEDWQEIEEGTYQNYKLMSDIDFNGRTNIKNNITLNRLEADNQVYTLKNIKLSYDSANRGFINNVKSNMKNIRFENIELTNSASSGNYFGVIVGNNANLENLQFINITVDGKGISNTGIIGTETAGNVKNIEVKNGEIYGNSYVGGLIGYINVNEPIQISNIVADNVKVEGTNNYIGGIIGRQGDESKNINVVTNNIKINNSNITGNSYVGGIGGEIFYGELEKCTTLNSYINGNTYVGGLFGRTRRVNRSYLMAQSTEITASGNNIGGIDGNIDSNECAFVIVDDCVIRATSANSEYVGGITGKGAWLQIRNVQVNNTEIYSNGRNVGGLSNVDGGGDLRICQC